MKTESLVMVKKGQVEITEVKVPKMGANDILVEVKANGICKGDVSLFTGVLDHGYPLYHGHEPAGIVADKGSKVKDFEVGDAVALLASPSFRKHIVAGASRAVKIPEKAVNAKDLALWVSEPVACAVNGVLGSNLKPGDKVALIGCGYMGLLLLQAMPREILKKLVVADPDPMRRRLAKALGAPQVVDPCKVDLKELAEEVGKFDVVIEASGAKGTLATATDMVRRGGILNIFGWHHGEELVPTTKWHLLGLRVLNTAPGFAEDFNVPFKGAIALMASGRINQASLITHRHSYLDAQEAFEIASSRANGYIKGVITF